MIHSKNNVARVVGGKSNAVLMGIVHRLNDTGSEEFENEQTSATIDCDAGMYICCEGLKKLS